MEGPGSLILFKNEPHLKETILYRHNWNFII
jgi:hypothetical protein